MHMTMKTRDGLTTVTDTEVNEVVAIFPDTKRGSCALINFTMGLAEHNQPPMLCNHTLWNEDTEMWEAVKLSPEWLAQRDDPTVRPSQRGKAA